MMFPVRMHTGIPAIYSVFRGGEVRAAEVTIDGTNISFVSEPVKVTYSADELDDRMPVLIADVKGLGRGNMDDRLLTNMRFPGSDVWFMTCIRDIEDVFDCFMGDTVNVLIPCHTVRNGLVMREAFEVSEYCIPVLFVSRGTAVCAGGQTKEINDAVNDLSGIGFKKIVIFDTDSSINTDGWSSLYGRFSGLVPFVRKRDDGIEDIGFREIISDL